MESRFGHHFGGVRVHANENAASSAKSVRANAYAMGEDVVFAAGKYAPHSTEGRRLLAHELAHVVQQGGGAQTRPSVLRSTVNPDGRERGKIVTLEQEAPDIQRDLAIEPPAPGAEAVHMTPDQIKEAIKFNKAKLGNNAALIGKLRDVLGIAKDPPDVDEDFVNAVVRWQAVNKVHQDGKLGPDSVAPLFKELRAEHLPAEAHQLANLIRKGRVKAGPTYTPHGVIAATVAGGTKSAHFDLSAEFDQDADNGIFASCCEVRQEMKWDAAAAASFTAIDAAHPGIPHVGFPAGAAVDTFIEDRNGTNTLRYGHRSAFSPGIPGNRFVNAAGGAADQANGRRFEANDNPSGPSTLAGQWQFRISVVDTCNGKRIGGIDTITINW